MSALRLPFRTYPVASYAVLACLFGWALYIAAALGAGVERTNLPLGPIAAALVVAALNGRDGLRAWGRQLASFRTSPWWYVAAVVAPVAIILGTVALNHAFGAPWPASDQWRGWTEVPANFVVMLILVGLGEEAGWTAFAAPRLLERFPFIAAWAVLSGIRIVWHLPLMLTGDLPWVLGVVGNLGFQFLLLWMYLRSRRAWFLAALWHAVLNAVSGQFFFGMVQGDDLVRLGVLMSLVYVLAAVVVLAADHRRLVQRPASA